MIPKGYYTNREALLFKKLRKTLKRYDKKLSVRYGKKISGKIQQDAHEYFRKLIPDIPNYKAAPYQEVILLNAQLIAIVRAMKKQGKTVEDTFKIQAELFKADYKKIPKFVGRIFVSRMGGFFLKRFAKKVTTEGWETEVIQGTENDPYDVSIITKKCGLVEYLKSEGMTDYMKYCNFSDFLMFPAMNIGLRQAFTIDSGKCQYYMKYRGVTEIPEPLQKIYGQSSQ